MPDQEISSEAPREASSLRRLAGVLFDPRATFASIAARPSWLLPVSLLIVVSIVLVFSFSQHVGWRGLLEARLANSPSYQAMSPQQQQLAIDRGVRFAPVAGYLGGTIGVVILLLVTAGVFLGAFDVVYGSSVGFTRSFAIASYAFLPHVIKGLLTILIIWVSPPSDIHSENLVATNPGVLWHPAAPWLARLLTSFDLFTFWTLALLAVGFAAASKKAKLGGAFAVVFAIWLAFVFISVGLTAAFS